MHEDSKQVTMAPRPADHSAWQNASDLAGATLDPAHTICLPEPDQTTCRAALAALANTAGGCLVLGVEADADNSTVAAVTGVSPDWSAARLEELAEQIDPPVSGLMSARSIVLAADRVVAIVKVRQSHRCPHVDRRIGAVFVYQEARGVRPITSRAELDRLYRKGSAADVRAQRSIEGMIERIQLASYGHHGMGIIACLRQPSAMPYVWASEHTRELVQAAAPFMQQWEFSASAVRVHPGEVEFRGTREVTGVLRITRAGCVAVGETLRRPQGDLLGDSSQIEARVRTLVETACTVLARADTSVIVPRLLCEGLRSTRLVSGAAGEAPGVSTADTLSALGPAGDATDLGYRESLVQHFLAEILFCYGLSRAAPVPDMG